MKRLNIGDLFDKNGFTYIVIAVKNSIALAKLAFTHGHHDGTLIYVDRGGFAGGA